MGCILSPFFFPPWIFLSGLMGRDGRDLFGNFFSSFPHVFFFRVFSSHESCELVRPLRLSFLFHLVPANANAKLSRACDGLWFTDSIGVF